jgi:metal-responsive CopG/Arc/MetJ family transcriptional regulator
MIKSKPKAKATPSSTRVHVVIDNDLLARFKEARWQRRLPSLSETIRALAQEALGKAKP